MHDDLAARPETLGAAADYTAAVLAAAGLDDARREARWLIALALDEPAEALIRDGDRTLAAAEFETIAAWAQRRAAREPLWRIAGHRMFYGRRFDLSPATLEPRPDSETLIDATLSLARKRYPLGAPLRIIDVGTGTGCLLLTLLAELPHAVGTGTDISGAALQTAQHNAAQLGLDGRATWIETRSLENIGGPYDILVSNPPYIPSGEIGRLDPEVRQHDPRTALDGGPDGLAIYREIAAGIGFVVPSGVVVLEVGAGQHLAVSEMLVTAYEGRTTLEMRTFSDLGGHERCVALSAH